MRPPRSSRPAGTVDADPIGELLYESPWLEVSVYGADGIAQIWVVLIVALSGDTAARNGLAVTGATLEAAVSDLAALLTRTGAP
jgi:hypothetical protein